MSRDQRGWKKFLFMGTYHNGYVCERKKWDEVVGLYKQKGYDISHLLKAKMFKLEDGEAPAFAFWGNDGLTLGEWAEQNDMNLL